jgi:HEAT repeat protein
VAVIGCAAQIGCESAGRDLADLADGIIAPTPAEAARMALDPNDPDERRKGTLLLANAPFGGNPAYLRMFRDYVENESNPLVKSMAIRGLARHGEPADAVLIAGQLGNPSVQVRWEAAKGLQRLHNPEVVPALLRVLRTPDEQSDVLIAAATALGQYPEDRVFQALVALLDHRELAANVAAEDALHTLTGQSFELDQRAWLDWYNARSGDRFAGGIEYLYPTYQRKQSWLEGIAFWSTPLREHPSQPAGLGPESERRTYEDEPDEAADG